MKNESGKYRLFIWYGWRQKYISRKWMIEREEYEVDGDGERKNIYMTDVTISKERINSDETENKIECELV